MQLKKSGPNWQIERCIPSWRCKATRIFGHSAKIIGAWLELLSDYFLSRSLQNSLNGKNFNNDDDIKSYLIQFFANKNHKFYERGITMLPERWQKIIDQNGHYRIKLCSSMKKLSLIF